MRRIWRKMPLLSENWTNWTNLCSKFWFFYSRKLQNHLLKGCIVVRLIFFVERYWLILSALLKIEYISRQHLGPPLMILIGPRPHTHLYILKTKVPKVQNMPFFFLDFPTNFIQSVWETHPATSDQGYLGRINTIVLQRAI